MESCIRAVLPTCRSDSVNQFSSTRQFQCIDIGKLTQNNNEIPANYWWMLLQYVTIVAWPIHSPIPHLSKPHKEWHTWHSPPKTTLPDEWCRLCLRGTPLYYITLVHTLPHEWSLHMRNAGMHTHSLCPGIPWGCLLNIIQGFVLVSFRKPC